MKGKAITKEEKDRMLELAAQGCTGDEIAAQTGRSSSSIYRVLQGRRVSTIVKAVNQQNGRTGQETIEYWRQKCRKLEDFILKMIIDL